MKKGLKIAFIVVFIVVFVFAGLVAKDLYVESKLDKIVSKLSDNDTVDMNIQTSGNYGKVEQLIKKRLSRSL